MGQDMGYMSVGASQKSDARIPASDAGTDKPMINIKSHTLKICAQIKDIG